MHEYDLIVAGGAMLDISARSDGSFETNTVIGAESLESAGGKGLNKAVAAARLGARAALIACIGQDAAGEAILAQLAREGVDARFVMRTSSPTGRVLVHVDGKGRDRAIAVVGANQDLTADHVRSSLEQVSARWTAMTFEIPRPAIEAAIVAARGRVAIDPAPSPLVDVDLVRSVAFVKANVEEAKKLTGSTSRTAASMLREREIEIVAVETEEGNVVMTPTTELWLPLEDVREIDATGAGDAFFAAMLVFLGEGRSVEECAQLANAAAALTTTKFGALPALPTREQVIHFRSSTRGTS